MLYAFVSSRLRLDRQRTDLSIFTIRSLIPILGFCVAGLAAVDNIAAEEGHIFCHCFGRDSGYSSDSVYYTDIFVVDVPLTQHFEEMERKFVDFLQINEPDRIFESASCIGSREGEHHSLILKRGSASRAEWRGQRVVNTAWTPMRSSGPQDSRFLSQPIRDFQIELSEVPSEVQICVRDHECEDGDVVRVLVNDRELINVEITNEWQCTKRSLSKGRHDIELQAANGTGYKGNCSYMNENTGEIRVSGSNTQTQSWRHRGGAGSSASINIVVR